MVPRAQDTGPRGFVTPVGGGARHTDDSSQGAGRRHLVVVHRNTTSEDEVMNARFDLFANELAAKFTKRCANTTLVISQSPLPKSTQELESLRASQINGCGWCIDMHTKEAAA